VSNSADVLQTGRLRVSSYDRAWSWLLALLLLIGTAAFILFMIWFSNQIHETVIAREVDLTEVGDGEGGGDGRPSGGTQLETPSEATEVPPSDTAPPEVEDTIAAVAEAVVEQVSQLDDLSVQTTRAKGDYGSGGGSGGGSGPGKGMGHGKGKPGRPQRWEIRWDKGNTIDIYARQLDFFKIELGYVVQGKNDVVYLSNFQSKKPAMRTGPRAAEKRYHFNWQGGDLKEADLEFFRRAGVSIGEPNSVVMMFIPANVEKQLVEMEKAFQNKKIEEIKYTRFGILSDGSGFKFNIIKQMLK
jgi:hypothetical protein